MVPASNLPSGAPSRETVIGIEWALSSRGMDGTAVSKLCTRQQGDSIMLVIIQEATVVML